LGVTTRSVPPGSLSTSVTAPPVSSADPVIVVRAGVDSEDSQEAPNDDDDEERFRVGEVLGDTYELKSLLGQGGMGWVFEAHDRQLERQVAIKTLRPRAGGMSLRREARALAAFSHPSLVTIHAMGTHRGREYLVMERVRGVSLHAHLRQRLADRAPFGIDEGIDLALPVAEALSVLHQAGLAHRDVKPSNVMLTANGRVVLMDFGLVVPESAGQQDQQPAGSPFYMAPEAFLPRSMFGTARAADLYSFGIMLYQLFSGDRPYEGETLAAIFAQHATAPVPDLRASRPDAPGALVSLVSELLSKKPEDRPQLVDEVIWRLAAVRRAGEGKGARPFSVLVVDDDADVARVIGFHVRKAVPDARVRTVYDGEAALRMLRDAPPDAMVLDIQMPRMNGIEVCMYMRGTRLAPSCAVVAVSAGAQPEDVQLLNQLGVRHVIPKGQRLSAELGGILRAVRGAGRAAPTGSA
jgi:serine/threonine-protein kinase